jgi:hypothetical protein
MVDKSLHVNGLSNDETTGYIDMLEKLYPDRITVYRKGKGKFWDGKVEMCNSFIPSLPNQCILFQVDVDEFWTVDTISRMWNLFNNNPEKMGAYLYCYYFIGPRKFITSLNTWGTGPEDWMRVFRFYKGFHWKKHEPPTLVDKEGTDWARDRVFTRDYTFKEGILFQHFGYSIPSQLRFKEIYYGYKGALKGWIKLQNIKGEIEVPKYLPWSTPGTKANDWNESIQGKLLFPGEWML